SLRSSVTGLMVKPDFEHIATGKSEPPRRVMRGTRQAWFDGGFTDTPVFDRDVLQSGNRIRGPAVVEEHASTTVLLPGDELTVDRAGNLLLSIGSADA
ncbi:MAG TPA: hypothetical protein VF447_02810, partial [Terriglobales bacterium]